METRTLMTFLKVVEMQSFSKAAEALGYTQSAVTIQIQHLEKELNVPLFDRIGKTISITHYGQEFVPYAKDAVAALNKASCFTLAKEYISGTIRIGTIESLMQTYFAEILEFYHMNYPNVKTQLFVEPVVNLDGKLLKNEVDLIYTLDYQQSDSNKLVLWEKEEEIYVVANPRHPIFEKKEISLKDLIGCEFAMMLKTNKYRQMFDLEMSKIGYAFEPFLELDHTGLVIRMVQRNPYVTVLPKYVVEKYINEGSLKQIPLTDCNMIQYRQLMHHKSKVITPPIQGFIDACKEKW